MGGWLGYFQLVAYVYIYSAGIRLMIRWCLLTTGCSSAWSCSSTGARHEISSHWINCRVLCGKWNTMAAKHAACNWAKACLLQIVNYTGELQCVPPRKCCCFDTFNPSLTFALIPLTVPCSACYLDAVYSFSKPSFIQENHPSNCACDALVASCLTQALKSGAGKIRRP